MDTRVSQEANSNVLASKVSTNLVKHQMLGYGQRKRSQVSQVESFRSSPFKHNARALSSLETGMKQKSTAIVRGSASVVGNPLRSRG